jgi:hypothetical protein
MQRGRLQRLRQKTNPIYHKNLNSQSRTKVKQTNQLLDKGRAKGERTLETFIR